MGGGGKEAGMVKQPFTIRGFHMYNLMKWQTRNFKVMINLLVVALADKPQERYLLSRTLQKLCTKCFRI